MENVRAGLPGVLPLWQLMRPHQWIKNSFVLLGLVFAHRWTDLPLLSVVGCAFLSFCAMASMVYVFNDLIDAPADRLLASKRYRPIARGAVTPAHAQVLCVLLACVSVLLAAAVSPKAVALVCCYGVLNMAYSHTLKHVVIADVFVISGGFMLRILMGTLGVGIEPSSWLMLCGMMLTLLLGFGKRRAELTAAAAAGEPGRKVLAQYDLPLIDQLLAVTAGCAILSYSIYTVSADTVQLHGTDKLLYTVPMVVYGIFRYLFLINRRGMGQDTARDVFADRHLLLTLLAWLVVTLAVLR